MIFLAAPCYNRLIGRFFRKGVAGMKFYTREGFYGEFRPDPRAAALDEALYREPYDAGLARYFDEMRAEYEESLAELRAAEPSFPPST